MKPTTLKAGKFGLILLALGLSIGLISWDYQQRTGTSPQSQNDTIPKKVKEKKVKDLDDVLAELETADIQVNMEQIQAEIAKALKEIDGDKIRMEIDKAMKEVDMKEIQAEIAKAMKEVDLEKIQQEVQASLTKVDWENINKELAKIKEIDLKDFEVDMKKMREEMKELGPKLEVEMKKAKEEIEKAKAEIKEYKEFVNGLDSDGLISKKEGYTLEHKNGVLLINDKKASEGTYNKYRTFLEKHPKFNIRMKDDDDQVINL